MTTTMNHPTGNEQRQMRLEQRSNGMWMNTLWENWKGSDWTRSHRSEEREMTKEEGEEEQRQWTKDMENMKWSRD